MKICKTCDQQKPTNEYPWHGKGWRSVCRECFNAKRRQKRALDELARETQRLGLYDELPRSWGDSTLAQKEPKPLPYYPEYQDNKPGVNILVIPDTQVKPGVPTNHLEWLSKWIAHKRPDVIVMLGDWFDFPSLSYYDQGKKTAEGRRVSDDARAGAEALRKLMYHWSFDQSYRPVLVFCEGNHDYRAQRYMEDNPNIDTLPDPRAIFAEHGWEVYPFLEPVTIEGVTFCHYSQLNANGKVMGGKNGQPSARAQAMREHRSFIAGHQQGYDSALLETPEGRIRSIIAGSFYMHDEDYLGPQGNKHWHGCLLLNDTHDGDFELCEISLRYLRRTYGRDNS